MNKKQRATLADVARRAGVSPVTVSRAIRHPDMVSEELRERIDEAVKKLNYIPNHLASALASTRTHIVGVIVPSLTNGVFDDYLGAIQDVLNPAGFQVLVLNVRYSEIEEEKAIQTLMGYHPEAMIVAGVDQTPRSLDLLRHAGMPVVQTMDVSGAPIDLNIGLDHEAAGAAAVRHLYELGHRKIAHLTARADPRARRRHAGYQRQMAAYGLSTEGLVGASPRPSDVAMGGELLDEILAQVPDVSAVFTCNDDLALGTLFECQRRGLRVPDDIAIVGFNDLDFCVAAVPTLTSVSIERQQMGRWAAESILEIIRGSGKRPKQTRVDVGFSIKARGSTAATRKPARKKG
ncbi:MAG: LacI family DNA-binding transcriptional regulator [Hyphomicrobiales bacterium]|nr:MAG: LacI family DNA-binding transcriptional regulator [Hyphomicrobiales bacterium]